MKTILITGITSELIAPFVAEISKNDNIKIIGTFNNSIPQLDKNNIELHKVNMSKEQELSDFLRFLKDSNIDYFLQSHGDCASSEHFERLNPNDIYTDLNVNLISTIRILQVIVSSMKRNNFGRVLLISTASAQYGGGITTFSYGLSKSGLLYTVKAMAKEYTKYNILTNAIAPGFFNTKFHFQRAKKTEQSFKERLKFVRIGRWGQPQELNSIIKTLLLDNTFISGEVVKVDGADFI
ncbi:3-oxoacyl-(acyl-carrier-protein) reductase [Candidatus Magnetoovum chiemensis]|nr:3-oxoacyl-(acyl-carrier-protein) reductase [Candidatus Magnetoovum chiemensis]